MKKNIIYLCLSSLSLFFIDNSLTAQTMTSKAATEIQPLTNSDFETGDMSGWKHWRTKFCSITKDAYSGKYALQIGPERAFGVQEVKVKPVIKSSHLL